jgi:hypothetical protein
MPTYLVKFTQTRRYAENVTAETPDLAIDEAIKALNRGELEPEDSTLDYFEAEEFAPSTGPPSNRLAGIHALPVTLFEAVLPQLDPGSRRLRRNGVWSPARGAGSAGRTSPSADRARFPAKLPGRSDHRPGGARCQACRHRCSHRQPPRAS